MSTKQILIAVVALTGAFALSSTASSPNNTVKPGETYGGAKDVAFAGKVWKAMEGYQGWKLSTDLFRGVSPHGKYVREYSTWVTVGKEIYPVIVKDNYGGRGVTEDGIKADPETWHKSVTFMVQRERGYDTEGRDWFYAKYEHGELARAKDGKPLAGRIGKGETRGGCVSCHSQAADGDFLYSNDPE